MLRLPALKCGGKQLAALIDSQGRKLDPVGEPVLPQRRDCIGDLFAGADSGEDERALGRRQQMRQGG